MDKLSNNTGIKTAKYAIWIIILFGVVLRLINIQMPLLEGVATRQVYNAMVTKYFYEHGLNFLYPFMEIRGEAPYVQALEAPVIPYIAAVFYRIFGGIHTEILRLISILSTVLATLLLYRLIIYISDKTTALIAAFLFTFFPISIFVGRSALHEMSLMLFTIATLYYFIRWTREEKISLAILANLFFVLAVLIKKTNLCLLLPLSYLAFSRWKWKSIAKNYLAFLAILAILAWQAWEWHLRVRFPDPQWIHFDIGYHIDRLVFTYTSVDFYKKVYADIINYVLTPLGITFFLIGLLLKVKPAAKVLYFWLASVMFFYLVMPEQFWAHGYYHMHYLPPAAFFIARGFIVVIDKISANQKLIRVDKKIIISAFAIVFIFMSMRYCLGYYRLSHKKRAVLPAARQVKNIVPKDALLISTVDNPVSLLYYSDRKGWPFNCCAGTAQERISELENLRDEGAEYLAAAYKIELKENKDFWNYLCSTYNIVFEDENSVIFNVQDKR